MLRLIDNDPRTDKAVDTLLGIKPRSKIKKKKVTQMKKKKVTSKMTAFRKKSLRLKQLRTAQENRHFNTKVPYNMTPNKFKSKKRGLPRYASVTKGSELGSVQRRDRADSLRAKKRKIQNAKKRTAKKPSDKRGSFTSRKIKTPKGKPIFTASGMFLGMSKGTGTVIKRRPKTKSSPKTKSRIKSLASRIKANRPKNSKSAMARATSYVKKSRKFNTKVVKAYRKSVEYKKRIAAINKNRANSPSGIKRRKAKASRNSTNGGWTPAKRSAAAKKGWVTRKKGMSPGRKKSNTRRRKSVIRRRR